MPEKLAAGFSGKRKPYFFLSGAFQAHAATLLFGLAGLFGKWIQQPASFIVFGRVIFATLALGLIIWRRRLSLKPQSGADSLNFLALGLLLAFHWTVFFHSIQVSTVAIGLLAYSTFPVFTSFLEPVFLHERFHQEIIAAALLCLFGVFWLIPSFEWQQPYFRGVIWGILAGLSFSLLSVANRRLTARYNSLVIAFYQDAGAAIFLSPLVFLSVTFPPFPDIARLAFLGVTCTALAHSLFIQAMKKITAARAAVISSLEPVYGIAFAFFWLKEVPAWRTLIGGLIILLTALYVTWRCQRR